MSEYIERFADDELVGKAQAGDVDAFTELVGRVQEKVYHTILGMTRNQEDAGDLAQETFMVAYRSLPSFKRQSGFYTWIYRIAVNLTLNFLKKKGKEKGTESFEDKAAVLDRAGYEAASPEGDSLSRELKDRIDEAIAGLALPYRAAFNLVVNQGMPHGKAAEILGCSENTVSWRMHKARKMLQAKLGPYLTETRHAL
jgi:RNA polymerase sigma-70 factor (ECF subfamily)